MKNNANEFLNDFGYDKTNNDANQAQVVDDLSTFKMQGFIRNLTITKRDGNDDMYKFQIRFIDSQDNLQEPEEWYSGFKEFPAVDGDYIIFTWKKNGQWNNVKEILDIKNTHDTPNEKDIVDVQEIQIDNEEPELKSDYEGESVTVANVLPREDLSKPYRALLLNGTIHLCTRRGTLTDAEIIAQYNRFLSIL